MKQNCQCSKGTSKKTLHVLNRTLEKLLVNLIRTLQNATFIELGVAQIFQNESLNFNLVVESCGIAISNNIAELLFFCTETIGCEHKTTVFLIL